MHYNFCRVHESPPFDGVSWVRPLQQTFNFFVTTPEQAVQVATNVMTATGAPAATGVGEAGAGADTTTTDQPVNDEPEDAAT